MSASALLAELQAAGVTLAATGDRLTVEAAPGIITSELTARLKAVKPELLAILAGNQAANDAQTDKPAYRWLVKFADREPVEVSYSPNATLAEVLVQFPDAISAEPIPSRWDNWQPEPETEIGAPDLPLLAAIAEFDSLIARLCAARGWSDEFRAHLLATRRRMSPDNMRRELPIIRKAADG